MPRQAVQGLTSDLGALMETYYRDRDWLLRLAHRVVCDMKVISPGGYALELFQMLRQYQTRLC